jgi:hypothetical protein
MVVIDEKALNRSFGDCTHSLIGLTGSFYEWLVVKSIHTGTYNDYGWLNEVEDELYETEHLLPAIFFHKAAWDFVINVPVEPHVASRREYQLKDANMFGVGYTVSPELEQFQNVCNVAISLRRDVFSGLRFQGMQEWWDDKSRNAYFKLEKSIFKDIKTLLSD